jgi:glycine/serine hydroxymethyltransferase
MPIWLGHPSSFAQRVLERMDAFLGETDYRDLPETPKAVAAATAMLAANAAHLAGLIAGNPYPGIAS